MNREARILLIIVLFAIGGVSVLAFMAQRYGKVLERRATTSRPAASIQPASATPPRQMLWRKQAATRALAEVDSFIEVRRSIHAALDVGTRAELGRQQMATARKQAIDGVGLSPDVYRALRKQYRQWRLGRLAPSNPLASAFETRKLELAEVDFGEHEKLDS